jgi:hypothetical protein
MTQSPFDQMSKQYLEEVLSPFGMVQRQYEVPGEAKFIDLWFVPRAVEGAVDRLGLLGRMLQGPAVFEPYRNAPIRQDFRIGTMKLIWVQEDERRKAKLDVMPEEDLPSLWILAPKVSKSFRRTFRLWQGRNWPKGVYLGCEGQKTGVVSIEELPETPETLWLRVLGRGETQKRAIAELQALPKSTPMRYETLQLVFSWRVTIDLEDLAAEFAIQEEIMALSEAYLAWETELKETSREEGLREGLLEGEEKRAMAIALNLLNQGIAMEVITKATGLTIAQIQQLQDGRTS